MNNLRATDPLSLKERAELEQQYDGPITEQNIADKIAGRGRAPYGAVIVPTLPAQFRIDGYRRAITALQDQKTQAMAKAEALRQDIAEHQAKRDATAQTMVRDVLTRQINRMAERLEVFEDEFSAKGRLIDEYREAIWIASEQTLPLAAE